MQKRTVSAALTIQSFKCNRRRSEGSVLEPVSRQGLENLQDG